MMTQGVMTQAVNLFGNATGSVTLKGKQNGSSFDLLMDSTMKSGSGAGSSESYEMNKVSSQSTSDTKKQQSDAVDGGAKRVEDTTQGYVKTEKTKAAEQAGNQTQNTENAKRTEDLEVSNTEEITVDEEVMEKIAGLLQAVGQTVMEMLNLTQEELEKLLSEQGLDLADLLQPDKLQQLILAESGTSDILAVLTDENLSETMNRLMQSVEELLKEAELGLDQEQLRKLLNAARLQEEASQITGQDGMTEEGLNSTQDSVLDAGSKNLEHGPNENKLDTSKTSEDKNIQVEVVKVTDAKESSSDTQAEFNRNEDREMNAAEQFEVFLNNLSKTNSVNQVDFNSNMVQVTDIREIANQIIEQIRVTIRPEQSSMELQLNPEHLGRVNLSIQSKDGVMTAQFVVQNEISKEAIESQLHTLKETLNQQGIKVEAIEVTVAAYSFEQNSQNNADDQAETKKGHNSSRLSLEEALGMTEDTEESNPSDLTGVRGSQIDYTA
jgi:flagellar hook-length control protein FliK